MRTPNESSHLPVAERGRDNKPLQKPPCLALRSHPGGERTGREPRRAGSMRSLGGDQGRKKYCGGGMCVTPPACGSKCFWQIMRSRYTRSVRDATPRSAVAGGNRWQLNWSAGVRSIRKKPLRLLEFTATPAPGARGLPCTASGTAARCRSRRAAPGRIAYFGCGRESGTHHMPFPFPPSSTAHEVSPPDAEAGRHRTRRCRPPPSGYRGFTASRAFSASSWFCGCDVCAADGGENAASALTSPASC
jgi:hypothetical protein